MWQFDRQLKAVRNRQTEEVASGILAPANGASDHGSFWFSWKRSVPDSDPSGMNQIFGEALNYLGPVGYAFGLPSLFKGEFRGDKEASLQIMFSANAVRNLYDEKVTSNALLWKALGNVAKSFDNKFGLPFNNFGDLPNEYSGVPEAVEACEIVKKNWGGHYCSFFGNEFLAKITTLRGSRDLWQKLKVFEGFYTKGFLANKIGSRLLVRYLSEVAALTYGRDIAREVTLQFSIKNAMDDSVFASPSLVSPYPPEFEILQTLGMMM